MPTVNFSVYVKSWLCHEQILSYHDNVCESRKHNYVGNKLCKAGFVVTPLTANTLWTAVWCVLEYQRVRSVFLCLLSHNLKLVCSPVLQEVVPDWQSAASNFLVELGVRFGDIVMKEFLRHFAPGKVPHFFIIQTVGNLAMQNGKWPGAVIYLHC